MPKRYWLLKSEPACFSIDHLADEPNQTASWDGVRNSQARNMLRDEIKKGDEAFFHYSGSNPPGIAGIVKIVKSGYPDHTAEDPTSQHPDPKHTKDNPIWYMVDVQFVRKFSGVIPLATLKQTPGLEEMEVCRRGSRLSIQSVRPEEWKVVLRLAKGL